eukprot:Sspe_Gene.42821::Locus_20834_Transcript_1_1_Confidence_1.000_Length_2112::g.42821::m.42821
MMDFLSATLEKMDQSVATYSQRQHEDERRSALSALEAKYGISSSEAVLAAQRQRRAIEDQKRQMNLDRDDLDHISVGSEDVEETESRRSKPPTPPDTPASAPMVNQSPSDPGLSPRSAVASVESTRQRDALRPAPPSTSPRSDMEAARPSSTKSSVRGEGRASRYSEKIRMLEAEVKVLHSEKSALEEGYEQAMQKMAAQDKLMEETKQRMLRQISSLVESKEAADREWQEALINKEEAYEEVARAYDQTMDKLRVRDETVRQLQEELGRWRKERDGHAAQSEGLVRKLREEIDTLSEQLSTERSSTSSLQERISRLEAEIHDLHSEVTTKDDELSNAQAMLQMKEQVNRSVTTEFEEFRSRVHRVVAEKDKELELLQEQLNSMVQAECRDRSGGDPSHGIDPVIVERLQGEVSRLQTELRSEKEQSEEQIRHLKQQLAELEAVRAHHELAGEHIQASASQLQQQLVEEQTRYAASKQEYDRLLREKEITVQRLEKQLARRGSPSSEDLSTRCASLGEALMEKQAAVESKCAEIEQLQVKLRSAQQRLREMELLSSVPASSSFRPDVESQDYVDAYHVGNSRFFQSLSRRGTVGERITRMATTVDSVNAKVATLLRRNAVLRVVTLVYFAMLHIWIFFFSLSSSTIPQSTTHLEPH